MFLGWLMVKFNDTMTKKSFHIIKKTRKGDGKMKILEKVREYHFHSKSEVKIAYENAYVFEGECGLLEKGALGEYEDYDYLDSMQVTPNGPFTFYIQKAE